MEASTYIRRSNFCRYTENLGSSFRTLFRFGAFLSFIGFALSLLTPAIFYLQFYKKIWIQLDLRNGRIKDIERAKVSLLTLVLSVMLKQQAVGILVWIMEKAFAFCRKTATAFVKLRIQVKKLIGERLAKSLKIPIMQNLCRQRKYLILLGVGLDYFHLSLNVNSLIDDEPSHLFMGAPSRTGKGIGIVIPTLLTWSGSLVCADPKRENLGITGDYRERCLGHTVFGICSCRSAQDCQV